MQATASLFDKRFNTASKGGEAAVSWVILPATHVFNM